MTSNVVMHLKSHFNNKQHFQTYLNTLSFRDDPVELSSFWYGLPSDIDHVDAVFEKRNHDIVFFVGNKFYVMSGNSQLKRGPQALTVCMDLV